ncbi:alkaline phosphatase family protein [Pseudomonas neustonica]|uniref:alkaline phosphatase family protein n=1 Tax=Pseudomonas neustonica TaxID=2487346 RepID=UPI00302E6D5B
MSNLLLGPVLSFRGATKNGRWKVSALIGVQAQDNYPELIFEGKPASKPDLLLKHEGVAYLRYDLSTTQRKKERRVEYGVSGVDESWHFTVPGKDFAPRMAYVSCNGFSDPSGIRKLVKSENEVWSDLLCNHDKSLRPEGYQLDKEQLWHEQRTHDKGFQRFHLLLMGGDQIYFDSIWEDLKHLKKWIGLPRDEQLCYPVGQDLEREIESYYVTLYSTRWLPKERSPWGQKANPRDAADAMARMPTVMMWDDHDIFDGWGSYSAEMQQSPLFKTLFYHARRAFWVFQMQHEAERLPELKTRTDVIAKTDSPLYQPILWSEVLGTDKLALPLLDKQPGFTFAHAVGPVRLVVADLRTERSHEQVMGPHTWDSLKGYLGAVERNDRKHPGAGCQHLLFMSSVPVVHPKLSLAEAFLDSFGSDHVLDSSADDLKDHWTHNDHEGERKRLIDTLISTARKNELRVTIVSGDVHVAAWGVTFRKDVRPKENWAQIQQLTSTAIVHPSLVSVPERLFFHVLNTVAKSEQEIDVNLSTKMMLFPGSNRYVMAARNWLALELDMGSTDRSGAKLWATWRCESKESFTNHLLAVDAENSPQYASNETKS